ncbi:MAG: hypothetical protein ABIM19_07890 [candidate division WOR-3 bacterium]
MSKKIYGGVPYGKQIKAPGENIPYEMPPDNYMLFGDPEGYYALIGYASGVPSGAGFGRGTGASFRGVAIFDNNNIALASPWDPSTAGERKGIYIDPTNERVIISAKPSGFGERARIDLYGAPGSEMVTIYSRKEWRIGTADSRILFDGENLITISNGTVGGVGISLDKTSGSEYARIYTPSLRLNMDEATATITIISPRVMLETDNRLDLAGAILRIPTSEPSTPMAGDMYVNTGTNVLCIYNGERWTKVALS